MSEKTVTITNGVGFFGACFLLFYNFNNAQYDLYDAIMHWMLK